MFKSKKKRLQEKKEAEAAAVAAAIAKIEAETSKCKLLDDIHLTHDFRSSVILPQLNKNIDPNKLLRQQEHLALLRQIPETLSPPLSPPPASTFRSSNDSALFENDGSKQYQDLAAWRHQKSQNRYSNGLFGGKQRGRPKPVPRKRFNNIVYQNIEEEIVTNGQSTETFINLPDQLAQESIDEASAINENEDKDKEEAVEEEEEEDNNNDEAEDEEELLQEEYEPDSDEEENFFFQDFSGHDTDRPRKRNPTTSNSNGRRRKSHKAINNKFNLSSFAKDLHDNRLSVIQPRESRIVMTEDDEFELQKLLERQRMSSMATSGSTESLKIIPPVPSLNLIKPHTSSGTPSPPASASTCVSGFAPDSEPDSLIMTQKVEDLEIEGMPIMNSDHGSSTENSFSSGAEGSNSPVISERESHHFIEEGDSNKIAIESDEEDVGLTMSKTPVALNLRSAATNIHHHMNQSKDAQSSRLSSAASSAKSDKESQSRLSPPSTPPLARLQDYEKESVESRFTKQEANRSTAMDDMQANLHIDESSVTSSALDWITEDSKSHTSKIKELFPIQNQVGSAPLQRQQQSKPQKSRSIFSNFRQVGRSKTHHSSSGGVSSIKGLVRNLSTSHQSKPANPPDNTAAADTSGLSRAAMAVIQHNVAKHGKNKAPAEKVEVQPQPQKTRPRSKSDANSGSGSRLIAHLLSRASSANRSKRSNSTKVVNMEEDSAAKKRAQVVRKTIIYVQPDSLHDLLKNGGSGSNSIQIPPLPRLEMPREIDLETRNTIMSDESLSPDDETIRSKEYITATKVSRQPSVRKRVVETQEGNNSSSYTALSPSKEASSNQKEGTSAGGMLSRNGSKRRWQLQSMDEDELLPPNSQQKSENYVEGVELREMSDGSVVWGVVKKQGNRKSFYAPNKQNELELVEDGEDNDEEEDTRGEDYFRNRVMKKSNSSSSIAYASKVQHNSPPPPVPRRSPRRYVPGEHVHNTRTDIFYSDQVTLPSLLKMMQERQHEYPGDISEEDEEETHYAMNEKALSSVDDQLDEMMRILTAT
ncbi:hypothetical protein [Parasitella parasitica]|uniref:Uncharacterized protein n=1 Tax=Parasitella parasitica TaxID=35722 RepID=A0A0B7NWF4_9FUNG|nr:hypothetical protein [Parasitella parasitica]